MISTQKLKAIVVIMTIIIVVLLILVAVVPSSSFSAKSDKLQVVTTFFPLYDFTSNVAGDLADIDILFTQTPEISSFKPSDIRKINNADILIINGAGLEPILDEMIQASDNDDLVIVDTSHTLQLLRDKNSNLVDPHLWLSPENAIIQVSNIRDGLSVADPANAGIYESNTRIYNQALHELDLEIKSAVATFSKRDVVVFHPAFTYFFDRYNINLVAVFEETPGKEPSPSDILEIIKTIETFGITALFAEPQFSPKIVNVIADDLNIDVKVLNPIETGKIGKDTYIDLMRHNLSELRSVLE